MKNNVILILLCIISFMMTWLTLFIISYKNSRVRNKIAMGIATHTKIPVGYSYSIFATIFYSGMPIIGSLILSKAFRFDISELFIVNDNIANYIIIGELSVLSLSSLPLVILVVANPGIQIDKEMKQVNWISGISKIPGKWSMLIPCISACCEEFFFRGIVLGILISAKVPFFVASIITTILFMVSQMVLAKKNIQAFVLGTSSLAISIVSCLLIGVTGCIIPSFVIHASFASFYSSRK